MRQSHADLSIDVVHKVVLLGLLLGLLSQRGAAVVQQRGVVAAQRKEGRGARRSDGGMK